MSFFRLLPALVCTLILTAQTPAPTDWPALGHDAGSTHYSPLSQITPNNVAQLKEAWSWDPGETNTSFETSPLVIDGVMYISSPREKVVALDAETGRQLWLFDTKVGHPTTHRGVSYWQGDRATPARIVAGTTDGRLFALDAKTGVPVAGFGDNGVVNLRAGVADNFPNAPYGISSPPAVYKDLLIMGPRTQESPAKGPSGDIRAFSARTGKLVWSFHTLPRPGEPGYETWGPDFWKDGSGPSAWAALSVDPERGLVFVPVGNPAGGGDPAGRKGINLYANCLVALNAATGKLVWYYQMVHHDIWDYDVTAPPSLLDVTRNGRKIPAIAQLTKQGILFILDRTTGKPIFGVEERPVPQSTAPGESTWPTQPFPLAPPPLARNSMSADEISRVTPEAERFCAGLMEGRDAGQPFTPRGASSAINFPSSIGGGNWGGVTVDPSLRLIFVNISNLGSAPGGRLPGGRAPARGGAAQPAGPQYFGESGGARFVDAEHYPCNQPPWGELIAINADTAAIAWRVPLGSYKPLEDKGIRNIGAANLGGSLATAGGVLFIGATNDYRFRAFNSRNGEQLWMVDLDGNALATPVTWQGRNGRQFVAAISGGPSYLNGVGPVKSDIHSRITVFALPAR